MGSELSRDSAIGLIIQIFIDQLYSRLVGESFSGNDLVVISVDRTGGIPGIRSSIINVNRTKRLDDVLVTGKLLDGDRFFARCRLIVEKDRANRRVLLNLN